MNLSRSFIILALGVMGIGIVFSAQFYITLDESRFSNSKSWAAWKNSINLYETKNWWIKSSVDTDWKPYTKYDTPIKIDSPETIDLKVILENDDSNVMPIGNRYLFLTGLYGVFRCYADGDEIYRFGDWSVEAHRNLFYGLPWHIIYLPGSTSEVHFEIYSNQEKIGLFGKSYQANLASLFWFIFSQSSDRLILGVLFVFIGLFSSIFILDKSSTKSFFLFGLFCLVTGLYTISSSPARLFFYDNHIIWTWINLLSVYSIPLMMYIFLERIFPSNIMQVNRLIRICWISHLLFLLFSILIGYFGMHALLNTLQIFQVIVLITGPIVISCLIYTTYKTPNIDNFVVIAGLSIFFLFGIHESLVAIGLLVFQFTNAYLGLLVLIFSFSYVLVRRFILVNVKLEENNRNLEQLIHIQQELDAARKIQFSLLPATFPKSEHWELSSVYIPMEKVGGDFYDLQWENGNYLGIFLADVSGHGLSTALLASMVKIAFSQQKYNADSPKKILTDINRIMHGKCGRQFLTASYIYLNCDMGKFRIANAGHPSLFHYSKVDDCVHLHRPSGRIIGVWDDARIQEEEYSFDPGDVFLVYSDGLMEVPNLDREFPDEDYLEKIFMQFCRLGDSVPIETFQIRVLEYLEQWKSGKDYEDDISFVILRCK